MSSRSTRDAFGRIPWLASTPAATLDWLAEHAVLHRVPAGVQLFEQAERPSFAQFLVAGAIELLAVRDAEEKLIELVQGPELLLPAAVLSRQPYLVSGRVREPSQLVLVQAEAFRTAVATDHALCLAVLACQAAQFRRQLKLAKAIRLRSAEERIGCYLLALAGACKGASAVHLPLEKRLIASQLGMTRETFSRALPAMIQYGLRVVGDQLHVEDLKRAQAAFPLDPLIDGPEPFVPLNAPRT